MGQLIPDWFTILFRDAARGIPVIERVGGRRFVSEDTENIPPYVPRTGYPPMLQTLSSYSWTDAQLPRCAGKTVFLSGLLRGFESRSLRMETCREAVSSPDFLPLLPDGTVCVRSSCRIFRGMNLKS